MKAPPGILVLPTNIKIDFKLPKQNCPIPTKCPTSNPYSEFAQVNMLPVDLRVKQLKLSQIYNIVHGKVPIYLTSSFSLNTSRHNTRSGPLSLSIPSVKSFGLSSFNYTGAVAWNDLPGDIKSVRTKPKFKAKVKHFYLTNVLNKKKILLLYHTIFFI